MATEREKQNNHDSWVLNGGSPPLERQALANQIIRESHTREDVSRQTLNDAKRVNEESGWNKP